MIVYFVVPTTVNDPVAWEATRVCNERLKELATKNGLPFLDIIEEINSRLGEKWFFDGTHLDPKLAFPLLLEKVVRITASS